MRWLPRIGWRRLTPEETLDLDLSSWFKWDALELTWLSFGVIIAVWPAQP